MRTLTIIDYNKYPFMKRIDEIVEKGITIYDLLSSNSSSLKEAKDRIDKILKDEEVTRYKSYKYPHLVFYSELLILSILGDKKITEKVLRKETKLFMKEIANEPEDAFNEILNFLKLKVEKEEISYHTVKGRKITLPYRIHFIDYLKIIRNVKIDKLSLSSQILHEGYVHLNKNTLEKLVEEKLYETLMDMIKPMSLTEIPESVKDMVFLRRKITPPCIKALLEKNNKNLEEIKILTTYMINIGMNKDSIISLLRNNGIPNPEDFVNKLVGNKKIRYIVYSCEIMKKMNLCVAECGVKNPLQLYFGKLEMTK